jgi:hypothetical protein
MLSLIRQILRVLIVFALVGGTTVQFARSAQYSAKSTMDDMPCDMRMSMEGMDHDKPMMPGKSMCPDCAKQMCCSTSAVLPASLASTERAIAFGSFDYWSAWSKLAGITRIPEPLPPRMI